MYLGYTLKLDGGRYKVYTPDGRYIGSADDAASMRRWIRKHRACRPVPSPSACSAGGGATDRDET